ncbi:TIGR03084 family metal-binding protein [Sciscionella sediminilitoris]|uniref:TIGR03084 family metal-binding protein n=1 Tax=Sciscionella sediminilitoris TaxID=1445613 RepID=UPI0004DF2C8B|nr:TIGR03084 family metal-binding protein [Sciscionella sp. SE31]
MRIEALLTDLGAESAEVDAMVTGLDAEGWAMPTPAPGWTIKHQIVHLAWTDEVARFTATDPAGFTDWLRTVTGDLVDEAAEQRAKAPYTEALSGWRAGREALHTALAEHDPDRKLPWFGPPMRVTSMVTARLMETWAHGQDIADTLGIERVPTARLRHVAHIGVRARDYAYLVHGLTAPEEQFRVELTAPDGERWTWGPEDAAQRVTGDALGFCLLAAQRRHRDDVDVRAQGADAARWLEIVQAFAGPAGQGRAAGQFA